MVRGNTLNEDHKYQKKAKRSVLYYRPSMIIDRLLYMKKQDSTLKQAQKHFDFGEKFKKKSYVIENMDYIIKILQKQPMLRDMHDI